jgi:hypothetical protein
MAVNRVKKAKRFQLSSISKTLVICLSLSLVSQPGFSQSSTITNKSLPISQTSIRIAQKNIKLEEPVVMTLRNASGDENAAPTPQAAEIVQEAVLEQPKETADAAVLDQEPESKADKADVAMLAAPVPGAAAKPNVVPEAGDEVVFESGGPIVIDNDEIAEVEETIKYEELPTDEGKTKVKTGAKFPVVANCEITSKTAKKGDPISGYLKYDLKIGDRLVAKKGSHVRGHINYALKARTTLHALWSPERWYKNSGCLGIEFDEIVNEKGEHLPLVAKPARQARIVKNKGEGRVLGVNHNGQITGPWAQQLRYKAVRVGLNAALAPAGVFSFGAMPVALGVMGAVNPSFAFSKPVGLNVRHRRIKGFAWGFLSGVPGSWLIEDTTVKGQEAVIKPGDEFLAEFKEEFTGEPATDAQLLPGASTKVRGQIMDAGKKKK